MVTQGGRHYRSSGLKLTTFARNAHRFIRLLACMLVAYAICWAANDVMRETHMNGLTNPPVPAIAVVADPQYVLDFPILVAITLRNDAQDTDYLNLPDLALLHPIDSLAIDLEPTDGGIPIRFGPTFKTRDENLFRTELMAGTARRTLLDLTQFGQAFRPGKYRLKLSIFDRPRVFRSSSPVSLEFIAPTSAERAEAARLRKLGLPGNMQDYGSWLPFLTNNWNTVTLSQSVGRKAADQLALYLALHRAAYGPEPLSSFPLEMFQNLRGLVISAEAAALEYELLAARGPKRDIETARSQLLVKWPDLRHRLYEIDEGKGLLRTLRRGYGAERDFPPPSEKRPYTVGPAPAPRP